MRVSVVVHVMCRLLFLCDYLVTPPVSDLPVVVCTGAVVHGHGSVLFHMCVCLCVHMSEAASRGWNQPGAYLSTANCQ